MALFRNAFGVLATSGVRIPLLFLNSIVLARFLTVEDRGIYGVAATFVALGSLILELGWGPAVIYRMRRLSISANRVAGSASWFIALSTLLLVGLSLAFGDWIRQRFMEGAPELVLLLSLLVIPIRLVWLLFASMARGLDRFALQNTAQIVVSISRLVLMTLALVVLGRGLVGALTVFVVSELIGAAMVLVGVARSTGIRIRPAPRDLIDTQRFAIQSYLARIGGPIHERVDMFMIAYFLETAEVAFYAIAVVVISQLKVIPEAIGRALYPQLAGISEQQGGALTATMSRHTMLWVGLSAVGAALLAPIVIPFVYGAPYSESVPSFMILLPGMALYSRYRILSNYFTSLDRQGVNMATQVVSVALNLGLNLFLIPRWGIVGAATASLISYGVASVWISTAFSRDTGFGFSQTVYPRSGDLDPYQRRLRPLLRRLGLGR